MFEFLEVYTPGFDNYVRFSASAVSSAAAWAVLLQCEAIGKRMMTRAVERCLFCCFFCLFCSFCFLAFGDGLVVDSSVVIVVVAVVCAAYGRSSAEIYVSSISLSAEQSVAYYCNS